MLIVWCVDPVPNEVLGKEGENHEMYRRIKKNWDVWKDCVFVFSHWPGCLHINFQPLLGIAEDVEDSLNQEVGVHRCYRCFLYQFVACFELPSSIMWHPLRKGEKGRKMVSTWRRWELTFLKMAHYFNDLGTCLQTNFLPGKLPRRGVLPCSLSICSYVQVSVAPKCVRCRVRPLSQANLWSWNHRPSLMWWLPSKLLHAFSRVFQSVFWWKDMEIRRGTGELSADSVSRRPWTHLLCAWEGKTNFFGQNSKAGWSFHLCIWKEIESSRSGRYQE